MRPDSFIVRPPGAIPHMDRERVADLRRAPEAAYPDPEVGSALGRLLIREIAEPEEEAILDTDDVRDALLAFRAILNRLDLHAERPNFRDRSTFWEMSWEERKASAEAYFGPLIEQLDEMENALLNGPVVKPVSPRPGTGWTDIDELVEELRSQFRAARTPHQHRQIGSACMRILQTLSDRAFSTARHGEPPLPLPLANQTALRLRRVAETELNGTNRDHVRELALATVGLATSVEQAPTTTRRDAGIAADATILLVHIMRRAVGDDFVARQRDR